jgi:hypothetical protein
MACADQLANQRCSVSAIHVFLLPSELTPPLGRKIARLSWVEARGVFRVRIKDGGVSGGDRILRDFATSSVALDPAGSLNTDKAQA